MVSPAKLPKARLLAAPVRWCLARRWRVHLTLALTLMTIAGASVLLVRARDRRTAREEQVAENWRRFERALELDDYPHVEALLTALAEHDPAAMSRLMALRRGEAPPGDAALARLLMSEHLRHNRWTDAAREAAIVVGARPGHMLARALLARKCVEEQRPADARAHLAAISPPFENADAVTPGALLLVIGLKRELGEDDSELLAFIALRLAPILKTSDADRLGPADGVQLLKCYHFACGALDRHPHLAEYWVPGARLLARIGNDPARAGSTAMLREGHLAVVYRLRQMNALPEKDAAELIREFEDLVAAEWAAAQARDEHEPLSYVGLALASHRRGKLDEARQWLERGLKSCENPRELYLALGRLLRPSDPLTGAVFLEQAYQRYPKDLAIAQLLAELAFAANRADRALDICRAVRETTPEARWAFRLEATACLALGRPTQALEALTPLRAELARDAAAMEFYVRAACAVGAEALVDDILRETSATTDGYFGAARGFLTAQRPADAARHANTALARSPEHAPARAIHAEALAQLAQLGDATAWPVERVREALDAFEWLRRRDAANRHVAQRIAWLQLRGLNAPALALRSAAPLREPGAVLTPEMNETLGAVVLANGEAADAVPYFDAAISRAPSRTGAYLGRAAARLRSGHEADAAADLHRAAALPRSPRQMAEWQRIDQQLRGEK